MTGAVWLRYYDARIALRDWHEATGRRSVRDVTREHLTSWQDRRMITAQGMAGWRGNHVARNLGSTPRHATS